MSSASTEARSSAGSRDNRDPGLVTSESCFGTSLRAESRRVRSRASASEETRVSEAVRDSRELCASQQNANAGAGSPTVTQVDCWGG